jgi:ParB family transcriptional regulator, chromosome partitioning protein
MSDKKPEKRGLGRGLSALLADVNVTGDVTTGNQRRLQEKLPVELLVPNPSQPRQDFPAAALADLADSIRAKGVIQPLIVRPKEDGRYEIVAGERRWRAAQIAQVHEVPVLVRDLSDEEVLEIAIIENIQRADLNSVEEALAYRQLMDRFGHTQEKLAESLAKSRSHIANTLRLLHLPDEVLTYVREGKLTAGHARALIPAPDPAALARMVIARGMTVRQAEELARTAINRAPKQSKAKDRRAEKDPDTLALEGDLSANLGMSVRIDHEAGGNAGIVSIRYNTLDQLDLLCRGLSLLPKDGVL